MEVGTRLKDPPVNYADPRWNHCFKKHAYRSRESAEEALARRRERLALMFPGAMVYPCRLKAGHWHIGH